MGSGMTAYFPYSLFSHNMNVLWRRSLKRRKETGTMLAIILFDDFGWKAALPDYVEWMMLLFPALLAVPARQPASLSLLKTA